MRAKSTVFVTLLCVALSTGCGKDENDLDRLEGTWCGEEGNTITFFAPDNEEENSGDIELVDDGESKMASYEWDEDGQEILMIATDDWGDTTYTTFKYTLIGDTQLELKITQYKDSVVSTNENFDGETAVFERK